MAEKISQQGKRKRVESEEKKWEHSHYTLCFHIEWGELDALTLYPLVTQLCLNQKNP